jgi:hypothetical protein
MKRNWSRCSVLLVVLLIFFTSAASAKEVTIKDIKQNLPKYENEVVTIEGSINKYIEHDKKTTNLYKLRDNWGETIFVRTSQELPDINKRWVVTGIVSREHSGTIYLSETSRTEVLTEKTPAPATAPLKPSRESIDPVIKYLLITAAAIFVVLVLVLIYVMTKRSRASEQAAAAVMHHPIPTDNVGKTVVMKKAPPGTLKLLPGKFIILKGDETHKEIRFQIPKDQTTREFTFGRQEIPDQNPYGHIQLKEGTVSRLHAKVIYSPDGVSLINYSTVNPTTVNKKALVENETVKLEDGDIITMGEAEFQYGAK